MDEKVLADAGYVHNDEAKVAHEDFATANGLHNGGPYTIQGVWTKGLVTLKFEQNISTEPDQGGLSAMISHPAVCVIDGPKGRVAVNADDMVLILDEADKLA